MCVCTREELRELIQLVKPQHFLPVHGEYAFLTAHAQLARDTGIRHTSVIRNGQMLGVSDRRNGNAHGSVQGMQLLGEAKLRLFYNDGNKVYWCGGPSSVFAASLPITPHVLLEDLSPGTRCGPVSRLPVSASKSAEQISSHKICKTAARGATMHAAALNTPLTHGSMLLGRKVPLEPPSTARRCVGAAGHRDAGGDGPGRSRHPVHGRPGGGGGGHRAHAAQPGRDLRRA